MADTKEGREKQADDEERRQQEREMAEARDRADEPDPTVDEQADPEETLREEDDESTPRECHRRNCTEPAAFLVLERYLEETGHGPVESEAALCREHTDEESPTNLDRVYSDYVFRVVPLQTTSSSDDS